MIDAALGEEAPLEDDREDILGGESTELSRLGAGEPEDFDFDEFVAGARGTTRSVRITSRGDLLRDVDELLAEASDPDITEERAEAALERLDQLKRAIWDSQRTFVVEGRSQPRRAKARQAAGNEPSRKASAERHVAYATHTMLLELADAIIVPSGVTAEKLATLYEECPGEIDKLWVAFNQACHSKGAELVSFSQRR